MPTTTAPAQKRGPYVAVKGAEVKRLRIKQGLTQRDVADMAGISNRTVSKIENGARGASVTMLAKLAAALGVQPAKLRAVA